MLEWFTDAISVTALGYLGSEAFSDRRWKPLLISFAVATLGPGS